MKDLKIQSQFIQLEGNPPIDAYLAVPKEQGTYPGIIVFQEIFGINAHIQDVCNRLAQRGFRAIAPAIFQRTAPGLNLGYSPEDVVEGRKHKDQTTAESLLADTQRCIQYLKQIPGTPEDFGCIGFCFGGHVAFLAATLREIKATASFYGAGITTYCPGGGEPSLNRADQIQGEISLFFGEEDPLIPQEQTVLLEKTLEESQVKHRVFRYPCGHGFMCDLRTDFHAPSAQDAWGRVWELFEGLKHGR